jgi:hypothetical protein
MKEKPQDKKVPKSANSQEAAAAALKKFFEKR